MDYSQFQVKYIDNPDINTNLPEISFTPDISNISYLNGEADSPVSLIQEQVKTPEVKNPVKRVLKKNTNSPKFTASKGLDKFNLYFNEALKIGGDEAKQLQSRRNILTHLAQVESSFDSSVQNKDGAPAFGYFQFMQGPYHGTNYNNIGKHAGVDINTFRNSPVLQIQAANRLANEFMRSFSKSEMERLHKLGWTDNAILAGCWLGGAQGVKNLAFKGIDASDGVDKVSKRMKLFNY